MTASARAVQDSVAWLMQGAPGVDHPQDVLQRLADGLHGGGFPLHRMAVFVTTLHPTLFGRAFLWRPGQPVEVLEAPSGIVQSEEYRRNPIPRVLETRSPIRRRLCDGDCPRDFLILEEMARDGVTDYYIQPLLFSGGQVHAFSATTRAPGGFSHADIAGLEGLCAPLARVAEAYAYRRTAANFLTTYVGRNAAERILGGGIHLGHSETIRAAVIAADLRGFSAYANVHDGARVLALLNRFFDCLVPAIEAHGGEVLKFMGDGLIAIFPMTGPQAGPLTGASAEAEALAGAHDAALAIRAALDAARPAVRAELDFDLRYGLALHYGDVLFGNIGAGSRLDFTVIGPVVNLAARLESVARDLAQDIVLSADFAAACPRPTRALGAVPVRGFGEDVAVYAPSLET
ncbi:MAG: adenylate/guanylate cyclase domain-containing protein [Alphaproteobacteria bacterium]